MGKEKKEIWKLIELLNEYNKIQNYAPIEYYDEWYDGFETNYLEFYKTTLIISKKFWFIKWLVENDKIDREKFWNSETKSSKYSDYELSYDTPREDYTNILLMELAIQDEPIQFLIEILR